MINVTPFDAPATKKLSDALSPRVAALSTYADLVASGAVDPLQAVADEHTSLCTLDQYEAQAIELDVASEPRTRKGAAA